MWTVEDFGGMDAALAIVLATEKEIGKNSAIGLISEFSYFSSIIRNLSTNT